MTDKEIKYLLNSNELSEIETSIIGECRTYTNKEFNKFTIDILRREITNFGLKLEYLKQQLVLKKELIIKLGIQILNALKDQPIEEEYSNGEVLHKSERPKTIGSYGVSNGFGVKYAILS